MQRKNGEQVGSLCYCNLKKLQCIGRLGFSKDSCLMPLVLPNITYLSFISYGANKQKIKNLDPCNCNVRANKNAGKAFSMQRYLYRCKGLIFLFSFVQHMKCNMQRYLYRCKGLKFLFSFVQHMKCNMQRYLYRCKGLIFLFSLVSCMK